MSATQAILSTHSNHSLASGGKVSLPTAPCSVVWSRGHAYVREGHRWVGINDRGRQESLTSQQLQLRGWSKTRVH